VIDAFGLAGQTDAAKRVLGEAEASGACDARTFSAMMRFVPWSEVGLSLDFTRDCHYLFWCCPSNKALALIWYRALTWYSLRLSPPRTHFEPWKAVGTRGRGSLTAR